jgi:hypothetical protein
VTAMMRLDTEPMTPGLRSGRGQADGMAVLIQVPRVEEPRGRVRAWRLEEASRAARPAWCGPSRSNPAMSVRAAVRPGSRRRLRRGVRRAGWSLLVLISMAGTFTVGWTTRGGNPRPPGPSTVAFEDDSGGFLSIPGRRGWRSDGPAPVAETDAFAIGPALGAPVAEAEIPVVLPGYVLPDDNREELAHEGS